MLKMKLKDKLLTEFFKIFNNKKKIFKKNKSKKQKKPKKSKKSI